MTANLYIDTEFCEDGRTIDLISIAMVAEDGKEFYGVSRFARLDLVPEWHQKHVLPSLPPYDAPEWMTRRQIALGLDAFVTDQSARHGGKVSIWGYYADYDYVCLAQLFGTLLDLPKVFPKFCMDLKQLSVMLGSPEHPPKPVGAHNALIDARWNRDLHTCLKVRAACAVRDKLLSLTWDGQKRLDAWLIGADDTK